MKFFTDNWDAISIVIISLLPALEIITRLTPTRADDTFVDLVKSLFRKIPNRRKGGGTRK
jgi:hypothetical protein